MTLFQSRWLFKDKFKIRLHGKFAWIFRNLTEGPLQDFAIHDGARLPVNHAMSDGLVLLPKFPLTLSRFDRGRAAQRISLLICKTKRRENIMGSRGKWKGITSGE